MKRALTSASNLRRRELCPGSARLEKDLPDIKSKESEQGDRLHIYSAHQEYERQLLSPEEQDLLRVADQLEAKAFDAIGLVGEYEEQREIHLDNGVISGHPDLMRTYPQHQVSVITDRKFGWAPVERADVNLQMRVYAVLAPTDLVYVSILQPRAPFADRVTVAKYNAAGRAASRDQIASILKATEDPEAPLVAGEEQCRFCRARATCPALREAVTKELVVFDDLTDELSKPAKIARIEARLAMANDEQLGQLYNACALARVVNDPLGDEMRRRIAAGQMKGFSVGAEFDVRLITDARAAVSLLVLGDILPRDEAMKHCKLDVGPVEEAYRKRTKVTAKQARADINKALESVIDKEPRRGRILRK